MANNNETFKEKLEKRADEYCGGVNLLTGTDNWISGERCFKEGANWCREQMQAEIDHLNFVINNVLEELND